MHSMPDLSTLAVVLSHPERVGLERLSLTEPGEEDVVIDIEFSGISTGTELLLWSGRMPAFPGMGYPLVPGYESVGRVVAAGTRAQRREGDRVFVPGARCYGPVRGLFGGAAARVVVPGHRAIPVNDLPGEQGVLLALAATAWHAVHGTGAGLPELIVGHGVLGRLLARITVAAGNPSVVVWERNPVRRAGDPGYRVIDPSQDDRRDYRTIVDVSGDAALLDTLIGRLAKRGEVVLAGFYSEPLKFDFAPAFMREARILVAAEWRDTDLADATDAVRRGVLSLDGLVTHRRDATQAADAYRTAFTDPSCLKMILDWRSCS